LRTQGILTEPQRGSVREGLKLGKILEKEKILKGLLDPESLSGFPEDSEIDRNEER
jgi:hypothetical protein